MRTIAFAIISTACTMLAWLWWNDRGIAIGKEETLMKWTTLLSLSLGKEFDQLPEDFLFINTANDLQLVEAKEYNEGMLLPIGNAAITDREKLVELFQSLSKYPEYKYVFLDILLDKRFETPEDSLLAEAINLTPRVVYAEHDIPLIAGLSPNKGGQISYTYTWINSDFCKYGLLTNEGPTMAYKAYREIFPEDDKDVSGSFMPRLYFNLKLKYKGDENHSDFFAKKTQISHLGVEVLNPYVDFRKLIKDKYIFIGTFDSYDTHDTYLNKMDGIQIHANAFANLLNRNHKHHPLVIISMTCISFIFYLLLYSRKEGNRRRRELPVIRNTIRIMRQRFLNKKLVRVILSFFTIELSFILLFFFLLFSTGRIVEITSLSLLFTILWNLPSNRIYNYIKHLIMKLMEKLKKLKVAFYATLFAILIFISSPIYGDSFRILYISSPNQVKCDTQRKLAGDTIFSDNKLTWMNDTQSMRVQNLSSGDFFILQQNPTSPKHNMTVSQYIASKGITTSRGDNAHTPEALRALIPDTLLLLDKIEIPTTLPQNHSQFFFIEYILKGESIKKLLPLTEEKLTIDRDIYTIDGEEIPAFTTPVNIYYYDKNTNSISIIGENKVILPLSL